MERRVSKMSIVLSGGENYLKLLYLITSFSHIGIKELKSKVQGRITPHVIQNIEYSGFKKSFVEF